MSSAHIDTIKRVYERWSRERGIDPDEFHPAFEIRTPMTRLEETPRRGFEGYRAWRAANEDLFTEDWFEPTEFEDMGDRVLVTGWLHLKGRASGVESRVQGVQLWDFTDGKPSGLTAARSRDEALESQDEPGPGV